MPLVQVRCDDNLKDGKSDGDKERKVEGPHGRCGLKKEKLGVMPRFLFCKTEWKTMSLLEIESTRRKSLFYSDEGRRRVCQSKAS